MTPCYFHPTLTRSVFDFRIRLAEKRLTATYPTDNLDFLMIDLEHPKGRFRHAHQCTTDLTGRTVEFLAEAHSVLQDPDDTFLDALYHRMMLQGNYHGFTRRYFPYLKYKNDPEAFRTIKDQIDTWAAEYERDPSAMLRYGNTCCCYVEGLADLYELTGDRRYVEMAKPISEASLTPFEGAHAHGLLCVLRAILKMARYSGDPWFTEKVRPYRDLILQNQYADGSVAEAFPRSHRNEGCSIGDWIMMNLRWYDVTGDENALDTAEHSMLNALFFNQFITGGFGHRNYEPNGYSTEIEEAWWCCTQTGGIALCEYAEHAVALIGDEIRILYPVPGVYRLNDADGRQITVTLNSEYPALYRISLTVDGAKDKKVSFRTPYYVKNVRVTEHRAVAAPDRRTFLLEGDIGHYVEQRDGGYVVKYGGLMLAPMIYSWGETEGPSFDEAEANVPAGYIHERIAGCDLSILEEEHDENGFLKIAAGYDLPEWLAFDDGVGSRTGTFNRAAANVTLIGKDGTRHRVCFHPMCYATSNLTLCHTPMKFGYLMRI